MSASEVTRKPRTIHPLSEILEEEKMIKIRLEMPGVGKDDLNITIENNQLRINARRRERKPDGAYLIRERNCADYEKIFTIDETIDRDSIDASMKDGILEVSLQFKKEVQPRRIEIKGA